MSCTADLQPGEIPRLESKFFKDTSIVAHFINGSTPAFITPMNGYFYPNCFSISSGYFNPDSHDKEFGIYCHKALMDWMDKTFALTHTLKSFLDLKSIYTYGWRTRGNFYQSKDGTICYSAGYSVLGTMYENMKQDTPKFCWDS